MLSFFTKLLQKFLKHMFIIENYKTIILYMSISKFLTVLLSIFMIRKKNGKDT